ncbi:MAG: hypothetical protein LBH74_03745 [Nitrososphaerota archaeon]|jgi:hypothetical protein|uniref:hypothetical protein n=1 Tax=Candidatus Bathycorpusculum sp. TaxID=2994959 RepID=UPI002835630A|nr:hypothetical protein [Candidatus Termitimicrobium sp.]MCL2431430.1 hypothetical protein [Candidatus Termitimicrobium sp.]MDR0492736.1 hypothetical protein [Nitrososphaerota archaeon]
MNKKVAVATVRGRAYFHIVNMLREHNISFTNLVPGMPIPPKVCLVITTPEERHLVDFERVLVFYCEEEMDSLINATKRLMLGKEAYGKIVIGIDPGEAMGLAVVADGKVIEQETCYSNQQLVLNIQRILKNINYALTSVTIKIGNGVPVYRDLLEELDYTLPAQVVLEVVGEAGTNRPLKEHRHSRKARHISSAIHIAGRLGNSVHRRPMIASNHTTQ